MTKAPEWLTGSAPIPRHECDKGDCFDSVIKFHHHEKTRSIYKCCYTCWTARAVSKNEFKSEASGTFATFQAEREAHLKVRWEIKAQEAARREQERLGDGFYESAAWSRLRYKTLLRYGRTCMCCGAKGPTTCIQVDHIKPRSKYPELALDPDNLQVLCKACNKGKSNWDETDFREPA